jgi:hypothetical protein
MKPQYSDRLRAELGPVTWQRRLASSPRSVVWTAGIASTPVVVKQIVGGAAAAARFDREVAALVIAARADPPVVPRLLGADPDERVLVLEHLQAGPLPDDWLVEYATSLARLHATAADGDALPRWRPPETTDLQAFLSFAQALDVAVPRLVGGELNALLGRLCAQPERAALLHGDPCPPNDLHTAAGARWVDLEGASLGDGMTELAYLRIGFPTCWCVTAPEPADLAAAEHAYRTAWRAATGADPAGDLTDACAGWLLRGDSLVERAHRETTDHLAAALRQDWAWGTATARQRLIHRLGVVAELATDDTALAAFGRLCAGLLDQAAARWPGLRPLPASRATAPIIRRRPGRAWRRQRTDLP